MLKTRVFDAEERDIVLYNGKAVIDWAFYFYTQVECSVDEVDFDFPDFVSAYWRVYNERSGRLLKDFTLSRTGAYLIANLSVDDATFEDNGYYYYEIGYVRGVYEQALRYGTLKVI